MRIALTPAFFPRQLWAFCALALCSEHTLAMNLTIWFEAISGVALAVCCAFVIKNRHAVQES